MEVTDKYEELTTRLKESNTCRKDDFCSASILRRLLHKTSERGQYQ